MSMSAVDPKTICVYCDTWGQGGIEAFITETLTHMDRKGLDFRLVCAEKRQSRFDVKLAECGLYVRPLQKEQEMGALRKTLGSIVPLVRMCRQEHIEVLHLNVFHGVSLLQAAAARMCGVKRVIVHCHGSGLRESRGLKVKLLGHYMFRWLFFWAATERWAASQAASRFLFGHRQSKIIPNGIEIERFLYCEEKRGKLRKQLRIGERLVLGCVGRLDVQKNQRFLLLLLAELKRLGRSVMLLLIGDGEDRPVLEQRAVDLGIREDIVFLGVSDRVNEWLCAMDLLLIPSTSEGLGIAAIEGQASGLPVFCSTGVPPEVKQSDAVWFLPLTSLDLWIHAIENAPDYDRAAMNAQMARSSYNILKSAKYVMDLYRNS